MFKFLRNLGCFTIIVLFVFLVVSIIYGGKQIREIGDKTTGILKKGFHYAAEKADNINKSFHDYFQKLSKPLRTDEKRDIDHKKP